MKRILYILLIFVLAILCASRPIHTNTAFNSPIVESAPASVSVPVPEVDQSTAETSSVSTGNIALASEETINSFTTYWSDFSMASAHYEFQNLKKLIQFPLKTESPNKSLIFEEDESDGVIYLYLTRNIESILDMYEIDPSIISEDATRIGNMVFSYINDTWKLTCLYLEDVDYELLNAAESMDSNGKIPLTLSELAFFSEFIGSDSNNAFLLSAYSDPSGIDLNALFYNGAGVGTLESNISPAEIDAYLSVINEDKVYLDLIKVTSGDIDSLLQKKMGISSDAVTSKLSWIYLSEFDAYYNAVGDSSYLFLYCADGYKSAEGTYVLHFETNPWYGGYEYLVTLRKSNDQFLFVSNEIIN